MQRQLKAGPFHIKAITGREVTGIFSVLGNLDDYDDRIWPGSFAKTFLGTTTDAFYFEVSLELDTSQQFDYQVTNAADALTVYVTEFEE